MATCKTCGKGWNSWGEYDDFCSDICEHQYKGAIEDIVKELYNISNQEVKDKIRELIEASIYSSEAAIDILEQVFSK